MAADTAPSPSRRWGETPRQAAFCLLGMLVLSTAIRVVLARQQRAPIIFLDELGYSRLAQSLAHGGRLSLFGQSGLSYPPLYPLLLAPIYALHASGVAAYEWIKAVNSLVMSLAVFPIYGIARTVLPRRPALLAAGLSLCMPLMYYTTLAMSESLTYPLGLASLWAMLAAVRAPSIRRDAVLLVSIAVATAARAQMIALFPAALTAVVLAALLVEGEPGGAVQRILRHRLLAAVTVAGVVGAALVELSGRSVFSVAGRYANVGIVGVPSPWPVAKLFGYEAVELSVALAYIPVAGALVAAYFLFRRRSRGGAAAFAAVSLAVTFWLMLEVAYNDAAFAGLGDLPRIHERYLIYVFPLFLIAFIAAARLPVADRSLRTWGAASLVAAVVPAVIPFGTFVNGTIVADTFGLTFFGRADKGRIVPQPHPVVAILVVGLALAAIGVVVRQKLSALAVVTAVFFLLFSLVIGARMRGPSDGAAQSLAHRNWVDRNDPNGEVVLLSSPGLRREVALETIFFNLSVTRLDAVCAQLVSPKEGDFGEQLVTIDANGIVRLHGHPIRAAYVVASKRLPLAGVVRARDRKGRVMLVATGGGIVRLQPGAARPTCA